MKKLRENNYIEMNGEGYITLTAQGRGVAETMYERHTLLSEFLIRLGVDKAVAMEDACRIEHVISPESFDAINVLRKSGRDMRFMTVLRLNTKRKA